MGMVGIAGKTLGPSTVGGTPSVDATIRNEGSVKHEGSKVIVLLRSPPSEGVMHALVALIELHFPGCGCSLSSYTISVNLVTEGHTLESCEEPQCSSAFARPLASGTSRCRSAAILLGIIAIIFVLGQLHGFCDKLLVGACSAGH